MHRYGGMKPTSVWFRFGKGPRNQIYLKSWFSRARASINSYSAIQLEQFQAGSSIFFQVGPDWRACCPQRRDRTQYTVFFDFRSENFVGLASRYRVTVSAVPPAPLLANPSQRAMRASARSSNSSMSVAGRRPTRFYCKL